MDGFATRIYEIDLTGQNVSELHIEEGSLLLYRLLKERANWDDPGNVLIVAAGPLNGTSVAGSGSFSIVTIGALTGGCTSTQANDYLGSYLKQNNIDALVIKGRSADWSFLYINKL